MFTTAMTIIVQIVLVILIAPLQVLYGDAPGPNPPVRREVEEAFKPEFHLKRIHHHYYEHCEDYHRHAPTGG